MFADAIIIRETVIKLVIVVALFSFLFVLIKQQTPTTREARNGTSKYLLLPMSKPAIVTLSIRLQTCPYEKNKTKRSEVMEADFLAFFNIQNNENHIPIVSDKTKNRDKKISSNNNSRVLKEKKERIGNAANKIGCIIVSLLKLIFKLKTIYTFRCYVFLMIFL